MYSAEITYKSAHLVVLSVHLEVVLGLNPLVEVSVLREGVGLREEVEDCGW